MKISRDKIELDIESIAFEGQAIARKDGLVYFVEGAVAGDKVLAEIVRKKRRYVEARTLEIIEPSEFRIKPECKYFGICGGCSWQNLEYKEQLLWKKRHEIDAFERIGKINAPNVNDTISSEFIYHYRNKMEFSFEASRWLTSEEISSGEEVINKDFALGLHVPGRFDKVLNIDYCHLQSDVCNKILDSIGNKSLEIGVTAYHSRNQEGFLRNLILRYSFYYNEVMVVLITNNPVSEEEQLFIDWYSKDFAINYPEISNIIHAVNSTNNQVAIDYTNIIKGIGYIKENILGLDFRISPFSFFQTNSRQLDNFFSAIIKTAELKQSDIVWDLFCGTGTISLCISKKVAKVYGFELSEQAVIDAKNNADTNVIINVVFSAIDLNSKNVAFLLDKYEKPNIIIIDPPRAGMHKNLIEYLNVIEPDKIVYVSCNPASQARDCELLADKYKVKIIQPIDMFPQTYHVESIALLENFY